MNKNYAKEHEQALAQIETEKATIRKQYSISRRKQANDLQTREQDY